MLVVDGNKVIETPVKNILESLHYELASRHIDKLQRIEYKQKNARVICPMHSDGHERTPSCDILLEDKGDLPAGTVHCFGCGYKGTLVKFVADCLDVPYRQAVEWLLSIAQYSLQEDIRDVKELDISNKDVKKVHTVVSLDELRQYDYIHPYMFKRKLTESIIEKFEVGYDPKLDAITFPVYVDGECRFVCKRRVSFKRFDMPTMEEKPIYGLDYVSSNEIYVVESIINCLTLWSWGYQAVALFGTGSSTQIETLKSIPQRKLILALDGDTAGRAGTRKLLKALDNKIVSYVDMPNGKDINDLSKEEFEKLKICF